MHVWARGGKNIQRPITIEPRNAQSRAQGHFGSLLAVWMSKIEIEKYPDVYRNWRAGYLITTTHSLLTYFTSLKEDLDCHNYHNPFIAHATSRRNGELETVVIYEEICFKFRQVSRRLLYTGNELRELTGYVFLLWWW